MLGAAAPPPRKIQNNVPAGDCKNTSYLRPKIKKTIELTDLFCKGYEHVKFLTRLGPQFAHISPGKYHLKWLGCVLKSYRIYNSFHQEMNILDIVSVIVWASCLNQVFLNAHLSRPR